ncbi:hypothetical protein WKT22_05148 [Candidatus Lokiarchaeum ossiferum]
MGGRCCWVISGTLCKGVVQGSFAQKYRDCKNCDFYLQNKKEEGLKMKLSSTILSHLK